MNASRQPTIAPICESTRAVFGTKHGLDPEDEMQEKPIPCASRLALTEREREVLFAEFAPLIRRLTREYGKHSEMRQDLIGEIYCRFCTHLERYDPARGVPLRPYLVRQLSLAAYTYARHQWGLKKREAALDDRHDMPSAIPLQDPTREWIAAMAHEHVATTLLDAVAKLPPRQRQVVVWRYYDDRSFEEIASQLAIQPASARSILRHGLNNLRKMLPRDGDTEE